MVVKNFLKTGDIFKILFKILNFCKNILKIVENFFIKFRIKINKNLILPYIKAYCWMRLGLA